VADITAICEPIELKIWEPRRLTTLWDSMACYRDRFTFLFYLLYCMNVEVGPTLREGHGLGVNANGMLRRMFGPNREVATRG
jgi:hypothetical protein